MTISDDQISENPWLFPEYVAGAPVERQLLKVAFQPVGMKLKSKQNIESSLLAARLTHPRRQLGE